MGSQSPKPPTKAQKSLLRWMVASEASARTKTRARRVVDRQIEWSGGDLINYYEEQAKVRREEWDAGEPGKRKRSGYMGAGGYAAHGWRRAGGTALSNLAKRGYVVQIGFHWGVPQYVLTDEGREAANG